MLVHLKKINNESGIVLFIVLMTAIIIMIFSVGILTQSVNEINYAQQQIDQIASEEYGKGIFWNQYSSPTLYSSLSSVPSTTDSSTGRTYGVQMSGRSSSSGIENYIINVSYNGF